MKSKNEQVYARKPLNMQGSIPVFSRTNEYTANYEKISSEHLKSFRNNGTNPFIPEEIWVQLEKSTIALIGQYSRPGDMVLDVGVGLGRLLSHFPDLRRYGFDISFGYLMEAQQKGIEVCYALIEEIPYKEEVFHVVVCTDVLEHVLRFDLCLTKILGVLKSGGVLIVRVPYKEFLAPYADESYPYHYAHVRNFDEYSLALQFSRCFGCEILDITYEGYMVNTNRFRYRIPSKWNQKLQRGFLKAVKRIYPQRYKGILKRLLEPAFINMAIRKPYEHKDPFKFLTS